METFTLSEREKRLHDGSTASNFQILRVRHFSLDLVVSFEKRVLEGSIVLDVIKNVEEVHNSHRN